MNTVTYFIKLEHNYLQKKKKKSICQQHIKCQSHFTHTNETISLRLEYLN